MKTKFYLFFSFLLVLLLFPHLVKANVDGLLAYGVGTDTIPKVRYWDSSAASWSLQVDAANLGTGATINWVVVKAAPTRNEYIMVTRDANDDIIAQVNKSGCWGNGTTCGNVKIITTNTNPTPESRSFDVEYENITGKAIIVFSDNTHDPKYITWNGVSWSTPASIGETLLSGVIEWVELTNKPNTDEIAAIFSDANDDLNAMIWDGNIWGCQPSAALAINLPTGDYKKFDAAYEGNSGDLFIISGINAVSDLRRHTKPTGSCTYTTTTIGGFGEIGYLVDVSESIPGVDTVIISEANVAQADHHTGVWSGTADRANGCADTSMATFAVARKETAAGYLGFSGREGIVVYADSAGTAIDWCTYNLGGNTWTSQSDWTPTPTIGLEANIEIYKFPDQTKVMVLVSDINSRLWAKTYDGTSWINTEGGSALTGTLSTINYQNFDFAFRLYQDLSFAIHLPGQSWVSSSKTKPGTLTTPINFSATSKTEYSVTPCVYNSNYCQDATNPIFNFTNTGNVAEKWNISLSQAIPSYIHIYGNTTSNPILQEITTSGWIAANNIPVDSYAQVWLWADFIDALPGGVDIAINHTSTSAT